MKTLLLFLTLGGVLAATLILCRELGSVREIQRKTLQTTATKVALKATDPDHVDSNHPDCENWPAWRGPGRNGTLHSREIPLIWSDTQHVQWKTHIPGHGHASPVVYQERVFVATADEANQRQQLYCFERATGAEVWKTNIHQGTFVARHEKNSHASATPGCDGEQVYLPLAADDAIWVTAVNMSGEIAWQQQAGPFVSQYGYASSPVLFGRLVIVAGDNAVAGRLRHLKTTSFLAALDRETGEVVWRVRRPNAISCGTPVVGYVCGRWQLMISGNTAVFSYDPATGEELWRCCWDATRTANTVAFNQHHVYATAVIPGKQILCIRADGKGDVTDSHVVWRAQRGAADVPSPLCVGHYLFVVDDGGIATLLEAATGHTVWRKRLGGSFSASPVAVGDRILVSNEEGTTYVVRAAAEYELISRNPVQEPVFATLAISRDAVFLRSEQSLFCIRPQATTVMATAQNEDRY